MARRARHVVATDVNPRALALARRSAQLSAIANVECRQGDWYEPVHGERFDLIACNPPYVVSPESRLVYRDGAGATEGVVRAAADHLVPGGLAELLVNWPHGANDAVGPLRAWLPAGCDALVVHHASLGPRQYAQTWVEDGPDRDERIAAWLEWYREREIAAIGAGFLLLRRRADDGPPRLQALEAVAPSTPRAGHHVERILAGTDLASGDEAALLAALVTVADGVRVEHATRRRAGAWVPGDATVTCVPTVGVRTTVPAELLGLLGALDGTRPLGTVLADRPAGQREAALAQARTLLERGFAEAAA